MVFDAGASEIKIADAKEITAQRPQDADKATTDIASWIDADWRCDPAAPDIKAAEIKSLASENPAREKVLTIADKGGVVIGLAVVRLKDARIRWLYADPTQFLDVAEKLCATAKAVTGLVPWGAVTNDELRETYLAGAFALDDEHPQYGGAAIRFTG